jgi:hypothetical protein
VDIGMGYGCDLAQLKQWFPRSHCVGFDRDIVIDETIWERGRSFSSGLAKLVVARALGADTLASCLVYMGDATVHATFHGMKFDVAICIGLLH